MFDIRVLIVGLILWAVQYFLAGYSDSLTPSGMRENFRQESILPLIWHGGIWFDFPLTFWLAYLTKKHPEWSSLVWTFTLALGFAASIFMHLKLYAPATLPNLDPNVVVTQEAHVQDGKVTEVGWVHVVFFAMAVAILLNEAFFSKNPSLSELWATTAIITALLFVGNHMVLGIIKELFGVPIDYRGKPLENLIGWVTVFGGGGFAAVITVVRGVYHVW